MSLQALALAITATGALRETLPAWARVEMEPYDALALAHDDERVIVAVFIGDETAAITRRRWSAGDTVIELVVQVLLPARIQAEVAGQVYTFDTKTGGARPIFALIHEALRRAFTVEGAGTWRELLQSVWLGHPEPLTGMPGKAEAPNLPPVPILDYSIPCSVICPPPPGEAAPQPWPNIAAKMRADPTFTPEEAAYFEALVAGDPLTEAQAELALAGLTRAEGEALGYGPVAGLDTHPAATRLTIGTPRGDLVVEGGA